MSKSAGLNALSKDKLEVCMYMIAGESPCKL